MIKSFKKRIGALVTVGPTVLWLGFFLMIPLIYVIGISFLTKTPMEVWILPLRFPTMRLCSTRSM